MHAVPDYTTLRASSGFGWSVSAAYSAFFTLAGVPVRRFFLEPDACIEAWRTGPRRVRELFGDDIAIPRPATPPISYGHVNCLGAELIFPEGGEVGHTHPYERIALDEAIHRMRQCVGSVDFEQAGMAPFYLEFRRRMEAAFPDVPVGFGFGLEGPITTAWELRGRDFFFDVLDNPERLKEFLALTVRSITEFQRFVARVAGVPAVNPNGGGLCDDLSSTVPPRLWPDLVLPSWDAFFDARTSGRRTAHVEDLRPDQLRFLEDVHLWFYDPSISPQLTPSVIAGRCRVPFLWRLAAFHYPAHTAAEIRDFAFRAVSEGASRLTTIIEGSMCMLPDAPVKVRAFIAACREIQELLEQGVPRESLIDFTSCGEGPDFWRSWQMGTAAAGGVATSSSPRR